MPVRNAQPYLDECLNSILNQTYSDWELIAVNDHSTDYSESLLKEYASKNKRITCFQNSGSGIIDALNTGYSYAKGRFVTRMDADDIMPLNKLELLSTILQDAGPGHLSTGKVRYISENELGDGFKKYENWLNQLCDKDAHFEDIYKECVIPSPCWMMYKEDFESIGAFDSQSYPEDYDLCFRMYENKIKVVPSSEVLHIWRDHGARASRNDENYSDNRFLELKVKYFLRNDFGSGESLIVWGAGKKGKRIAQLLLDNDIDFLWVTNNDKKIGKHIYSKILTHPKILTAFDKPRSIILAVANEDEQNEINGFIKQCNNSNTVYTFC